MFRKLDKWRSTTPNILIFGQRGAGKGPIISILQGRPVNPASDDAMHVTHHRISHRDKWYTFWNTPDLDEPFPAKSVRNLQSFVDEYSFDLLIYCIQGRLVDMTRVNYEMVWRDICKKKVPIMLVVTGLKGRCDGDEWWHENEEKIEEMKMSFDGHICIPNWNEWIDYAKSEEKLWSLVRTYFEPRHNVILFGEAGTGKSSIVNMIVGKSVAKVSSFRGTTFKSDAYNAIIGEKRFVIYDTAGLNEGEQGRVPHWEAIRELYTLIRQLDGVSLLIYCMRGSVPVRENTRANWNLFNKVICGENVPIIAIVTGLEIYRDPDELNHSDVFKKNGMEPKDVGCVISIRGEHNQYSVKYAKSQAKVRTLVTKHCLQKSWSEEKEKWFAAIYSEARESGLFFTARIQVDYSEHMRNALDEFVRKTGMTQDDTEKLQATLLKAEKVFRNRLLRGFVV